MTIGLHHVRLTRGHTYLAPLLGDGLVIDGGAHRGEFATALAPKASQIVALEPNRTLAAQMTLPATVTFRQAALGARAGTAAFDVSDNLEASSIIDDTVETATETYTVDVLDVPTLLSESGRERIDLLKLDVEGAEFDILTECPTDILDRTSQITVEFHPAADGPDENPRLAAVIDHLTARGFLFFKASYSGYGDCLFVNRNAVDNVMPGFGTALPFVRKALELAGR